jgi:hypothetical protein
MVFNSGTGCQALNETIGAARLKRLLAKTRTT